MKNSTCSKIVNRRPYEVLDKCRILDHSTLDPAKITSKLLGPNLMYWRGR